MSSLVIVLNKSNKQSGSGNLCNDLMLTFEVCIPSRRVVILYKTSKRAGVLKDKNFKGPVLCLEYKV